MEASSLKEGDLSFTYFFMRLRTIWDGFDKETHRTLTISYI